MDVNTGEGSDDSRMSDAVVKSLRSAGINPAFVRKQESLVQYGDKGKALAKMFGEGTAQEMFKAGRGLFFVGDGTEDYARFQLTCRAAVLCRMSLALVSLPDLIELVNDRELSEQLDGLRRAEVLAINGFYDNAFEKPFAEAHLYRANWFLREQLAGGQGMILQSTSPIPLCKWWTPGLLGLMLERLQPV